MVPLPCTARAGRGRAGTAARHSATDSPPRPQLLIYLFLNKNTNAPGCIININILMGNFFSFPRGSCGPQVSVAAGWHLRAAQLRGCRGSVRGHASARSSPTEMYMDID